MFDKVYVLSLRKDKDRRQKILNRLSQINLEFEFNYGFIENIDYIQFTIGNIEIFKMDSIMLKYLVPVQL